LDIPFKVGEEFEDMEKWDWSRVKVRLVLSIAGNYEGVEKMRDFGLCRIGSVLEEEGWVPGKGEIVKAEYQVSITSPASKALLKTDKGIILGSILD